MTGFFILFILLAIMHAIYVRVVPVRGVYCINEYSAMDTKNTLLLDLRDYNEVTKMPIYDAYNLPLAYLKRYHNTIQNRDIIIIASDVNTINMGVRFLKRKGFTVMGYLLTECDVTSRLKKCCIKGGTLHGI